MIRNQPDNLPTAISSVRVPQDVDHFIQLDRRFIPLDRNKDPETLALESYVRGMKSKELGLGWAELVGKRQVSHDLPPVYVPMQS